MRFLCLIRFIFYKTDCIPDICAMTRINGLKELAHGYYHLCTDGWKDGLLFHDDAAYVFGMNSIALIAVMFPSVKVICFTLMPNHVHIILFGPGYECARVFCFLKRRLSTMLVRNGRPGLPRGYGFKLIRINNRNQLRQNIIYVARNPYEKFGISPFGYCWGSFFTLFSDLGKLGAQIEMNRISRNNQKKMFHTHVKFPRNWIVNPNMGMICPDNYVEPHIVESLFESVRQYQAMLVKDYEAFVQVASQTGEDSSWDSSDVAELIIKESKGHDAASLSQSEKALLAVRLSRKYKVPADQISFSLGVPLHVVLQILGSKEYRMMT